MQFAPMRERGVDVFVQGVEQAPEGVFEVLARVLALGFDAFDEGVADDGSGVAAVGPHAHPHGLQYRPKPVISRGNGRVIADERRSLPPEFGSGCDTTHSMRWPLTIFSAVIRRHASFRALLHQIAT